TKIDLNQRIYFFKHTPTIEFSVVKRINILFIFQYVYSPVFSTSIFQPLGDTLLAIRAPSGTQLEVPIPECVVNGQKKYQIHLKSSSGPIEVLLVNKDPSSKSPVVLPVPPPDNMLQSLPASAACGTSTTKPADNSTASAAPTSQSSANAATATTAAPTTGITNRIYICEWWSCCA
uniref:E2F transcription factor CC-MB domain-containing protein n=1 Tax=Astyanax mexicanus TaxID=7994 RepID=A0A8B9R555_ASTMX